MSQPKELVLKSSPPWKLQISSSLLYFHKCFNQLADLYKNSNEGHASITTDTNSWARTTPAQLKCHMLKPELAQTQFGNLSFMQSFWCPSCMLVRH